MIKHKLPFIFISYNIVRHSILLANYIQHQIRTILSSNLKIIDKFNNVIDIDKIIGHSYFWPLGIKSMAYRHHHSILLLEHNHHPGYILADCCQKS